MKKRGYLLVEMMIAVTICTVMVFIIAIIQSQIVAWHKEAEQYLMATTLAQHTLSCLAQEQKELPQLAGFEITVHSLVPQQKIPFMAYTVTVSFKTLRGVTRKVILAGGNLYAKK